MKELKNPIAPANDSNNQVATNTATQPVYVKPTIEVIQMELEGPILAGSDQSTGRDFTDGGRYGR